MRIADEFGYDLVIDHGTEAHLLAGLIAARGIPVIIGPLFTSRSKVELRNRSLANPGRLAAAGVTIAITTDHPVVPINFLVHQATLAVKEGLDPVVALAAITINPARIAGIDDRLGSIEVGKDADLVIWSGDPLDVNSRVELALIEGAEIYSCGDGDPVIRHPLTPPGSVRAECRFRAAAIMTSMISTVFPRNLARRNGRDRGSPASRGPGKAQRSMAGAPRDAAANSRRVTNLRPDRNGSAWRSAAHCGSTVNACPPATASMMVVGAEAQVTLRDFWLSRHGHSLAQPCPRTRGYSVGGGGAGLTVTGC